MSTTSAFVVDVNVAIVANGRTNHADLVCMKSCVEILTYIQSQSLIVLDDKMFILKEYISHLSASGQPGLGDAFMQWVWENQGVVEKCEQVSIKSLGSDGDFDEFPRDSRLERFDLNDRKYVAVALKSKNKPEIVNAVDSDWYEHREALFECGLQIQFICPQHIEGFN
jgi:hypothetical protein